MCMADVNNAGDELLMLVKGAIERDDALRQKYEIGDKFRFIRERLMSLLEHLQEDLAKSKVEAAKKAGVLVEADEIPVFVHLFNSKGLVIKNWKNMVLPNVFYEYSVNRPIYTEKTQIDSFIRSRPNKQQHGYLTVAVKKTDVTPQQAQDGSGYALVKVKEGALRFEKLISFTHNEQEYQVDEEGELIKKE